MNKPQKKVVREGQTGKLSVATTQVFQAVLVARGFWKLSGPLSRDIAILSLRYPVSLDTFSARLAVPQSGAILNCGLRGGTGGAKPGSGVQRFWGPLGASEFDLPRLLEPRKGSQGLGGGSSGASERCVRFQRSGERRWAIQRPQRGPVFPDAP